MSESLVDALLPLAFVPNEERLDTCSQKKKIGMFELVLKIVLEVTDELSYHSKNQSSAFKLPPPQQAKSLQMGALVCVLFIERSRN